ncbi:MAG TPA: menaquinone biosynthesis decarboxylase [Thermoanaerobaculia bacterium]|jgi:4-hydroxy-3-polyprenylbenzoate decarboxylase|nr:menaquinone biosynthesis decarboxylase [Thermoanaerobaculia bacterium]
MAYRSLGELLRDLEKDGELVRVAAPVSPRLEISEIADRAVKGGGPALLFENVQGSKFPVAINVFASRERMRRAVGIASWEEWDERLDFFLDPKAPEGLLDKLRALPKVTELAAVFPKTVKSAPCQEIVATGDAVNLGELPVLTCWPQDAGPFITMPLVITKHASTGKTNVGMYRMQVYDRATTGMHWQKHKDGAGQARGYEREGRRMEVAVAIGADPATVFSAIAPLPPGVSELLFAGFLRGEGVPLVRAKTVDLMVPAEAEFVLEGYVDPSERRREGPFGDHTGFYSLDDDFPVFHVTAITRRERPVYLTTIVGRPPMEDGFMGEAVERLFLPLVKKTIPEIRDMYLPVEGIFHNLAIVSIDKRYPGHARKTMHAIWGMGQLMFTKTIVVVDADVDVRGGGELLWRVLTAIDPERDVEIVHGPVDELDFASRLPCYGSKLGVDATRKWKEEGFERRWPDEIVMSDDVRRKIDSLWPSLGIRLKG